jgi:hypothetical protein
MVRGGAAVVIGGVGTLRRCGQFCSELRRVELQLRDRDIFMAHRPTGEKVLAMRTPETDMFVAWLGWP